MQFMGAEMFYILNSIWLPDRICMNRLMFKIVASVMAAYPHGSGHAVGCLT